jgi:hypothetical protein
MSITKQPGHDFWEWKVRVVRLNEMLHAGGSAETRDQARIEALSSMAVLSIRGVEVYMTETPETDDHFDPVRDGWVGKDGRP